MSPGERKEAWLLDIIHTKHEEALDTPVAFSTPGENDQHHLMLLLPGGTGLESIGSVSGVWSRRATPQRRLTQAQIRQSYRARQPRYATKRARPAPSTLPRPTDAQRRTQTGDPNLRVQDGRVVVGPDGRTTVVGGTYSTIALKSFTVISAPELGGRTIRLSYQADRPNAVRFFRVYEVGQNPGPWRAASQTPTHVLSCGEGTKQLRFQLRGDNIPNPNLPSQEMANLSNMLQKSYVVPDSLKTRITNVLLPGTSILYPSVGYSANLKIRNFAAGSVKESEFTSPAGSCMKVMKNQGGSTVAPDPSGQLEISRRVYFPGPGACRPVVHVPKCPGLNVFADEMLSVQNLETVTVSKTWDLQGIVDIAGHGDLIPGVCSGVNEAPVGVRKKDGDIAIEVRPTPLGTRCLYSSRKINLLAPTASGVSVVSTDWSVHRSGLCKVNSTPKLRRGYVVLRANGTLSLEPPMIESYDGKPVLYDGVIKDTPAPGFRYAAWLPMMVELECPPGPPGAGFVRVELEKVTLQGPPGFMDLLVGE